MMPNDAGTSVALRRNLQENHHIFETPPNGTVVPSHPSPVFDMQQDSHDIFTPPKPPNFDSWTADAQVDWLLNEKRIAQQARAQGYQDHPPNPHMAHASHLQFDDVNGGNSRSIGQAHGALVNAMDNPLDDVNGGNSRSIGQAQAFDHGRDQVVSLEGNNYVVPDRSFFGMGYAPAQSEPNTSRPSNQGDQTHQEDPHRIGVGHEGNHSMSPEDAQPRSRTPNKDSERQSRSARMPNESARMSTQRPYQGSYQRSGMTTQSSNMEVENTYEPRISMEIDEDTQMNGPYEITVPPPGLTVPTSMTNPSPTKDQLHSRLIELKSAYEQKLQQMAIMKNTHDQTISQMQQEVEEKYHQAAQNLDENDAARWKAQSAQIKQQNEEKEKALQDAYVQQVQQDRQHAEQLVEAERQRLNTENQLEINKFMENERMRTDQELEKQNILKDQEVRKARAEAERAKAEMLQIKILADQKFEEVAMRTGQGMMSLQDQINIEERSRQAMEEGQRKIQHTMAIQNQELAEQVRRKEQETKTYKKACKYGKHNYKSQK